MVLSGVGRDAAELVEGWPDCGNVDREHLGYDAGPAVDEVDPAVLDGQVARLLLGGVWAAFLTALEPWLRSP